MAYRQGGRCLLGTESRRARRCLGEEGGAACVARAAHLEMWAARVALGPMWVGGLGFQTRLPGIVNL
ncbi:hypothetical protein amrb99_81270 [Actinomadura sp. RB99]|nr:hypothetical protein [Actinomadura sp. RB99]